MCYFNTVPNVIWAAIIASILTFTGVLLTNRHFSKQQRVQLDHEKEQKDADRKFELRQSVYLDAAGELMLAQQHLGNLSNIDITKNNLADNLTGFFVATTKACLVASDDTAKSINELLEAYLETYFLLLARVSPIQSARTDRDIQDASYEGYQAEISRILASMAQFREAAKVDSVAWDALQENLAFNIKQSSIAVDARGKVWDELNRLKIEFSKQAISEMRTVAKLTVPALVAIRTELGIASDIDAYHADLEKRYLKMEKLANKFLAELIEPEADQNPKGQA